MNNRYAATEPDIMLNLKTRVRGIVASLHTPFTEGDDIDPPSMVRLVEHCRQSGCCGVLVNAVAGEVSSLSAEERQTLLQCVARAAGDRLTVIAGISAASIDDSVVHARAAARLAIPVLMWQPPPALDHAQLRAGLQRIAAEGEHQIMLQDLDWIGPGIPAERIARLAQEVPALTAVKVETAPAGPKYTAVSAASTKPLHLSGGWAVMQMLDGLARGLDAFIPSGLLPAQVRLFSAWARGDEDEARRLFDSLLPVLVFSNQHIDVSIRFWKQVRVRQGIFSSAHCRLPPRLDAIQEAEAVRLCDRVIDLETRYQPGG